ncbi:uncharacterized protein ASCRUDRAFT_37987 [Ascoidea rubescens DSM 1968]|uniref:LicD/FKTN/FKRP nucleotidyltransferase domain-containing protein n=1 Tax=Ascoidea rubescens DSM 1968 TaxID=1344418 RepID=A0A1D2VCC9_9ASCO|nr:hypothetical protein ASCRUDRAFT_37987 [Ascoidea rubescens DSM 1968]ODV59200.1 hypothetical protein ASCRUDRAFT_37987 [Ascoidea rubescens DSM 1968]
MQVDEHLKSIAICSAIWKKYYFSIPERILFESDINFYQIPVDKKGSELNHLKSKYSKHNHNLNYNDLDNNNIKKKNIVSRNDNIKLMQKLDKIYLKKGFKPNDLSLKLNVSAPTEDFTYKPDQLLNDLNQKSQKTKLSTEEKNYRSFLQYSKDFQDQERFYFTFPFIHIDNDAELHHYNFPFIKQIITHDERLHVIHHLVRSWFKFCENYGIVTWINYGNLIGWWFNAQNLPWDNDVDVQVSIQDLDKIGRLYNNSLIVENPKNGNALFWLQTDPFYPHDGLGKNFIDARFIDTRTGIYIDVSALWNTPNDPPNNLYPSDMSEDEKKKQVEVHCKHWQWFLLTDIFPLRRTIYEGAQAYIPRKIETILNRFYSDRAITETRIFKHNYQEDISLWVPDEICNDKPNVDQRFDENGFLTIEGACNNSLLKSAYDTSKDAIELHRKEFELYKDGDKDTSQLSKKELPVFRQDPFEYVNNL